MKVFDYNSFDFIVSIDFGTTYSGSCFINIGGEKVKAALAEGNFDLIKQEIKVIESWGDKKVPTVAIYSKKNKNLVQWGNEAYKTWRGIRHTTNKQEEDDDDEAVFKKANQQHIILRKFKLKITDSAQNETEQQSMNDDEPLGEESYLNVTATIDYLRIINDTAYEQMKKNYVISEADKSEVDKSKIRYILTVPAQWTDDDRAAMRIMAKEAGIITKDDHENRLIIINESFAATLFCEREGSNDVEAFDFEEGKKYLICDAGGGTVDLATYESTVAFDANKKGRITGRCQLTTDSGDMCGSGYLDDNMENLLIDILFHGSDPSNHEKLKRVISPLMVQFIERLKPHFKRARDKQEDTDDSSYNDDSDNDDSDNDDSDDEDEKKRELFDTIFNLEGAYLEDVEELSLKKPILNNPQYIIEESGHGSYTKLRIRREAMCDLVFDPVVSKTMALIENQMKKANSSKIHATFLLGGFGKSSYLTAKIEERFKDEKEMNVFTDSSGETAAMKGAIYFGLYGLQTSHETSIVHKDFASDGFDPKKFEVLICIDIGYEFSSCCYFILDNSSNTGLAEQQSYSNMHMIQIEENWPGKSENSPYRIPTVLEYTKDIDGNQKSTLWGAQVEPYSRNRITLSQLMSANKDDFQEFLTDYLDRLHEYVCISIKKNLPNLTRDKFRYCLTMENCFKFCLTKDNMWKIAAASNIVKKTEGNFIGDHPKRLLLINREDASAMFYEKQYSTEKSSFSWKIRLTSHNKCYLSFHGITTANSSSFVESDQQEATHADVKIKTIESKEIDFNFATALMHNLKESITQEKIALRYISSTFHRKNNEKCDDKLKDDLFNKAIKYIASSEELKNGEKPKPGIIRSHCCEITYTVKSFLEYVIKPSIENYIEVIQENIAQTGLHQIYNIEKIFVLGELIETQSPKIIEKMFAGCLFQHTSIVKHRDDIKFLRGIHGDPTDDEDSNKSIVMSYRNSSTANEKKRAYIDHFLQIHMQNDCCYLNLHEATTISGKKHYSTNRNVRKLRSTTLEFNFIDSLIKKLLKYSQQEKNANQCLQQPHGKDTQQYNDHLRDGLMNYIKTERLKENLTNNPVHVGKCCLIHITTYDFIARILKPAIQELMENIHMHAIQAGMTRRYVLNNVFILGTLVEASDEIKELIESTVVSCLSESMPIEQRDDIVFTTCKGNEVINGAAMYGLNPTIYTERISRKQYAVSVVAYATGNKEQQVVLHYQESKGSSKTRKVEPSFKTELIKENDTVTADMQSIGTFKRFFADQDCIVYATIYATDKDEDMVYKKIHQFEIPLEREKDKHGYTNIRSRLIFEIRLIFPNNNEARFEANVGQIEGKKIPEFRFRDEILVANVF